MGRWWRRFVEGQGGPSMPLTQSEVFLCSGRTAIFDVKIVDAKKKIGHSLNISPSIHSNSNFSLFYSSNPPIAFPHLFALINKFFCCFRMEQKETCCCGPFRTDVQTGAFLVALAGVIFSFLGAIISFLPTTEWHEHDPLVGLMSLFSVLLYSGVIFGQKKKKPVFYLPLLFFGAIEIAYYIFVALVYIARSISPPEDLIKQFQKENPGSTNPERDYKFHSTLECVFLIFGTFLSAFFYSIIWRSYKKIREELDQSGYGQRFVNCV